MNQSVSSFPDGHIPVNGKAFLGAVSYLAFLFVTATVMWWAVLIGGNPFTVETIGTETINQVPTSVFKAGDFAVILRKICASHSINAKGNPRLIRSDGLYIPLTGGTAQIKEGCNLSKFALSIPPNTPPGRYSYSTVIEFQNNLVGRDEYVTFPALDIEVTP
jgi:hypothetical protein